MAVIVQDYAPLIALCHSRWVIPALAELYSLQGSKLVTLSNRLDIAQTTARRALDRAITLGYARRNTGYGHPLRPEFLCTPHGSRIASRCIGLLGSIEASGQSELCARKWSVPILVALANGSARFGELSALLDGVSDRALAIGLRELTDGGLIQREVIDEHPPGVTYRLTPSGQAIATAGAPLSREDAREAREILTDLDPGLWRLQRDYAMLYYVPCRVIAAECHSVLGHSDTAAYIFDDLLADPGMPRELRTVVVSERTRVLGNNR